MEKLDVEVQIPHERLTIGTQKEWRQTVLDSQNYPGLNRYNTVKLFSHLIAPWTRRDWGLGSTGVLPSGKQAQRSFFYGALT